MLDEREDNWWVYYDNSWCVFVLIDLIVLF